MVPPKDPQALIRATARLRDEGLCFTVNLVGKPTSSTEAYFQETRELVSALRLKDRVALPGFVPDTGMPSYFAKAHVGVQTSRSEGMSIAVMEQMMAGLAIVATDVGDTAVAIRNEETGLLIPPGDDESLAAALRRLFMDDDLRRRLGRAAREEALRRFSIEAMTDRAIAEYRRVLGCGPQGNDSVGATDAMPVEGGVQA